MRTAVAAKSGHQTGASPSGLSCTPDRASQPSDVHVSPGCPLSPVDRGLKRQREMMDAPTPPCSPASSSTSPSSSRRAPRVQAKLKSTVADGLAAVNFRSSGSAGHKWLSAFISERWGCRPGEYDYSKLARRVQRSIKIYEVEKTTGEALQKPGKRMVHGGSRCRVGQQDATVQQHEDAGVGPRVVSVVGGPCTGEACPGSNVHDYSGGAIDDR